MRRHLSTSDAFTSQALQWNSAALPGRPPNRATAPTTQATTNHRFIRKVLASMSRGLQMDHHPAHRSEEHTSELQSLMRISYAVFCLKKKTTTKTHSKI